MHRGDQMAPWMCQPPDSCSRSAVTSSMLTRWTGASSLMGVASHDAEFTTFTPQERIACSSSLDLVTEQFTRDTASARDCSPPVHRSSLACSLSEFTSSPTPRFLERGRGEQANSELQFQESTSGDSVEVQHLAGAATTTASQGTFLPYAHDERWPLDFPDVVLHAWLLVAQSLLSVTPGSSAFTT